MKLLNGFPDLLSHPGRSVQVGVRKDYGNLHATITGNQVARATHYGSNRSGNGTQTIIPHTVPINVVKLFKMVDI
jgi:hypothetical protein